jgi:hypothetical protein
MDGRTSSIKMSTEEHQILVFSALAVSAPSFALIAHSNFPAVPQLFHRVS